MSPELLGAIMPGLDDHRDLPRFPIPFTLLFLALGFGWVGRVDKVFHISVLQTAGIMKEEVLAAFRDGTIDSGIAAMNTTIGSAGRLVIPREIRREAGLRPGMPVEVRWRAGRIEIEPLPLPVKLVRRGRLLVAVPDGSAHGTLAAATVERTRRTLRRERMPRA